MEIPHKGSCKCVCNKNNMQSETSLKQFWLVITNLSYLKTLFNTILRIEVTETAR